MRTLSLALALAALSVAGCDNAQRTGSVGASRLCMPFPAVAQATGQAAGAAAPIATDPSAALEDCLHRWGYALAVSRDDASQVATATVAACGTTLARWNQQTLTTGGEGENANAIEAPSLLSGQPTTPIAEHFIFAQGRALFYVVQARAGKCGPPPIMNGVPTGLTG